MALEVKRRPGELQPGRESHQERGDDPPLLRDHSPVLPLLKAATRSLARRGSGPTQSPPQIQPSRHPRRRGRQDHLPPPGLPLRAGEDRHVPQALPRRGDLESGGKTDPEALGHEALPSSQRYSDSTSAGSATRNSSRISPQWLVLTRQVANQFQMEIKAVSSAASSPGRPRCRTSEAGGAGTPRGDRFRPMGRRSLPNLLSGSQY